MTIAVTVPATTANLGSGFDCIGAALNLYNRFVFAPSKTGTVKIAVTGIEAPRVTTGTDNLLYLSFLEVFKRLGQTAPLVEIHIHLGVPLSRGLGSSATAIAGGLVAANAMLDCPLDWFELMEIAIAIEGHPDNVVPALLGGCRLAVSSGKGWEICEIPWHENLIPVVAVPDFELSTRKARSVLPSQISRSDAIFNTAHFGLLLQGLATGNSDWLRSGMEDRLHQPYRQPLIPGYDAVSKAAFAAGAYGVAISGAGPTLLALTHSTYAEAVATAMAETWQAHGIGATARSLALNLTGAEVEPVSPTGNGENHL